MNHQVLWTPKHINALWIVFPSENWRSAYHLSVPGLYVLLEICQKLRRKDSGAAFPNLLCKYDCPKCHYDGKKRLKNYAVLVRITVVTRARHFMSLEVALADMAQKHLIFFQKNTVWSHHTETEQTQSQTTAQLRVSASSSDADGRSSNEPKNTKQRIPQGIKNCIAFSGKIAGRLLYGRQRFGRPSVCSDQSEAGLQWAMRLSVCTNVVVHELQFCTYCLHFTRK